MRYHVTALLNMTHGDRFNAYRPGSLIGTLPDLDLALEGSAAVEVLEPAFAVGNHEGKDADGREWPSDVRSLSVGDVLAVRAVGRESKTTYFACDRSGWTEVPAPAREHVGSLLGSDETSRA